MPSSAPAVHAGEETADDSRVDQHPERAVDLFRQSIELDPGTPYLRSGVTVMSDPGLVIRVAGRSA